MTTIYVTKIVKREERPVLETRLDLAAINAVVPDVMLSEYEILDIDYLDEIDALNALFQFEEPSPQEFIVRFEHFHQPDSALFHSHQLRVGADAGRHQASRRLLLHGKRIHH